MLAIQLPKTMSIEDVESFTLYFTKILNYLDKRHHIDLTDPTIESGISYFSDEWAMEIMKYWKSGDVVLGTIVVLRYIKQIVYSEAVFFYAQDHYKVSFISGTYKDAISNNLKEWHREMMVLAHIDASYEEGYQATMSFVKEYWISQPAQGSA